MDLFPLTRDQVLRDLNRSGIDDVKHVLGAEDWNDLHEALSWLFSDMIEGITDRLPALLYQADISESKVKSALDKSEGSHQAALAHLFLKREVLKVIFRLQYSGG